MAKKSDKKELKDEKKRKKHQAEELEQDVQATKKRKADKSDHQENEKDVTRKKRKKSKETIIPADSEPSSKHSNGAAAVANAAATAANDDETDKTAKKKVKRNKKDIAGTKVARQEVTESMPEVSAATHADEEGAAKAEHDVKRKKKKKKKGNKAATESAAPDAADIVPAMAEDDMIDNGEGSNDDANGQSGTADKKAANRFQRVKSEEWTGKIGSMDNSYVGTFGEDGWGFKAQQVLGQVRGKDFRHEKTKKKRGSYFGGKIDDSQRFSFKFDSDDE